MHFEVSVVFLPLIVRTWTIVHQGVVLVIILFVRLVTCNPSLHVFITITLSIIIWDTIENQSLVLAPSICHIGFDRAALKSPCPELGSSAPIGTGAGHSSN
ncbi:hypothetical protein DFJ58DRAFT_111023 [Suillus subalutaceus]|uniref:uncharacterized protein n=1 Tax=Suillus subalutaceus TaxID=48586 RepID=UPI001B87FDCA|nr:uncharacterized protein DFJ58DRAFT_111023 [Suillus subalutaceus]KAG1839118.1 hypothetical protein DFJ58DRAFT_111023 [Suillus subalutaceus]